LAANAFAAAVLYWSELDAQIRVEGPVERVETSESDDYFAHRPRGHRIGAWASHQSAPVADRATLEAQVEASERRFPGVAVPRPPHWGGYRIVPETVEFWRNRADRVHDRVEYTRRGASWRLRRLSP
jgi:pyridoxamine 5'-phosphate oxidase